MGLKPTESDSTGRQDRGETIPQWIEQLGTAVWIRNSKGRISYINQHAETLLGRSSADCIGERCYRVIAGRNISGAEFCCANCPVVVNARGGRDLEPFRVLVGGSGTHGETVQIVPVYIPSSNGDGDLLVHCAIHNGKEERFKRYLERVAKRMARDLAGDKPGGLGRLTKREKQVLRLLADDESTRAIAARLNLSYSTVRNHVQHIIKKVGVHSIMEAVAVYYLTDD